MSEDNPQQPRIEEQLGGVVIEYSQAAPDHPEGSHDELKQYGREIYQGVQALLEETEGHHIRGRNGWETGDHLPSHVSEEFRHNAQYRSNLGTTLFTERLRVQETEVVAPYKVIEGGKVKLELIELPSDPRVDPYQPGKNTIRNAKRLDLSVSPDGNIVVDSYRAGYAQIWGDVIDGPGAFGHGDGRVPSEHLDFGEEDAQRLLGLIGDIRSDLSERTTKSDHSETAPVEIRNEEQKVAEEHNLYADRLEKWTAALEDNPPSEAFKQRFGIESINPRMLTNLERSMMSAMSDESASETAIHTAQLQKTFLEDIRSGRAAQWQ